MPAPLSWPPPNSVIFVTALCLLMLVGEVFAAAFPGVGNPSKFAFSSFLPVALWMLVSERQRDVRTIGDLETRMHRLEEGVRAVGGAEGGASPVTPERTEPVRVPADRLPRTSGERSHHGHALSFGQLTAARR